jgi:hypothetical protein
MADPPKAEDDRRITWIDPDYDERAGPALEHMVSGEAASEQDERFSENATVSDHPPAETPTAAARALIAWFAGALAFEAVHAFAEAGSTSAAFGYGIGAVAVAIADYNLKWLLARTPAGLTRTLNQVASDARWWVAAAMLSLFVIAISPYIEQRRWPFAWQFDRPPAPPSQIGFTQQQVDEKIAAATATIQAKLDDMTRQRDDAIRQREASKATLAGRNETDIRRIQNRVQEICEYLNGKKLALARLDNFTKFSIGFAVSSKTRALQSTDEDRKNVADLYSEVVGGFPDRFRTDWREIASIVSGDEGMIGSLSNQIDAYRSTLARISEPATTSDVDDLLNIVRPLQTSVPAFQQWLNSSLEKCIAKKADLERTPLNAN